MNNPSRLEELANENYCQYDLLMKIQEMFPDEFEEAYKEYKLEGKSK